VIRSSSAGEFRPAEWNVHQGALVGHERGEGLHFFRVHVGRKPDPTLTRELVMAMLGPPGVHHLNTAVVPFDGEAGVEDRLAGLDVGQQRRVVGGETGRPVEGPVHLLEKAGTDGHGGVPVDGVKD
jgi:hypothetical protein